LHASGGEPVGMLVHAGTHIPHQDSVKLRATGRDCDGLVAWGSVCVDHVRCTTLQHRGVQATQVVLYAGPSRTCMLAALEGNDKGELLQGHHSCG
jgi:hypothetical protein